jgi:hypothetical protein
MPTLHGRPPPRGGNAQGGYGGSWNAPRWKGVGTPLEVGWTAVGKVHSFTCLPFDTVTHISSKVVLITN